MTTCRPSFWPKSFFIIFGVLCRQHVLEWGLVSFGATCMGRMAKHTTTLPWWWLGDRDISEQAVKDDGRNNGLVVIFWLNREQ